MAVRIVGRLTVLSGPSGVGKGSVVAAVRGAGTRRSGCRSASPRAAPRPGEVDGEHYHFVDERGSPSWSTRVSYSNTRPTAATDTARPAAPVLEQLAAGRPALLEIDLQGARQVGPSMPDAQLVFLAPPSLGGAGPAVDRPGDRIGQAVAERLERGAWRAGCRRRVRPAARSIDDVDAAADELVTLMAE